MFNFGLFTSGLVKQTPAYTGVPTLPFSPVDISGLKWWLDFTDKRQMWKNLTKTIPVAAANDEVAVVGDKSGNGWDATQTTASKRPTFISRAEGCQWDGIDDYLEQVAAATPYAASVGTTMLCNFKLSTLPPNDFYFYGVGNDGDNNLTLGVTGSGTIFIYESNGLFADDAGLLVGNYSSVITASFKTVCGVIDASVLPEEFFYFSPLLPDPVGGSTGAHSSDGNPNLAAAIGANRYVDANPPAEFLYGRMRHLLSFSRPLSLSEITQVVDFIEA